jgi:ribonuclease BN (tRNA processing enzyme)
MASEGPPLRLLCLGVGDAFSARWYSSCLAVEAAGTWLLIDCPHPIRKVLKEASEASGVPLDVAQIAGVVLTHLHADHASGLEGFGFYSYFTLKRRAPLLVHPDVAGPLWEEHLRASMSRLTDPHGRPRTLDRDDLFDVHPLSEQAATRFGPFTIECRRTIHPIPTFALRIQAAGRCLAYSCDTAYDPTLIDWLARGDLIIHETNRGLHTPYEKLASLPADLRSRIRLIHYPDDFPTETSLIEPLRQGRLYEVE